MVGALQLVHRLIKRLQPVLIHTGDRLIQNQQIGLRGQRQCQQHTLQFAAGKRAQRALAEPLAVRSRQRGHHLFARLLAHAEEDRPFGKRRGHEIRNRHRGGTVEFELLGHVARAHVRRRPAVRGQMADDALVFHLSQQRADERRLARAVRADERGQLAAMDVQVDVVQKLLIARRYAQVIDLDAAEPARRMAGAVHMRVTGVVMRNLRLNRFFLRHLESASVSTLAFSRMMVS